MLIGHESHRRDFEGLVRTGRLAHGYLFFGPAGAGKTTFALALAHYLERGTFDWPEPAPTLSDLLLVGCRPGDMSVGIDHVRDVRHFLSRAPAASPYRVAIIADGEHLTAEAENALLKIIEEPGTRALICVIVDDPERLLSTVRSRLQGIYFGSSDPDAIAKWLVATHGIATRDAREAATRSGGMPGMAWRFATDERFRADVRAAERYLELASDGSFKDFVKGLVDDESFVLERFLGAMAYVVAPQAQTRQRFWHALMDLRRATDSFNLNPRMQLLALAAHF